VLHYVIVLIVLVIIYGESKQCSRGGQECLARPSLTAARRGVVTRHTQTKVSSVVRGSTGRDLEWGSPDLVPETSKVFSCVA